MNILKKLKNKGISLKNQKAIKSFLISLSILTFSCNGIKDDSSTIKLGVWTMEMDLNGSILPFNFELHSINEALQMTIINGKERIEVNEVEQSNDSLFVKMPVFESEFILEVIDDTTLRGSWTNNYKSDDYIIAVNASYGGDFRFKGKNNSKAPEIQPKYEVTFSPNLENQYKAIGLFEFEENKLLGTFATETGDYRYLEGVVFKDSILLSTFDGSHAFLFKAKIIGDSLSGVFYSGTHHKENWVGIKNELFSLRDADSLTTSNSQSVKFKLPNENDSLIDIESPYFNSKVKLVQIMGSWCPNCLDESKYYSELYSKYNNQGLEIIGVAFERTKNKEKALANLYKLKSRIGANYTFLLGGSTREENPLIVFPMLNHIMSYPTTIYLDKENKIRKIHTGYYGPSTGIYYEKFTLETEKFISELLAE